MLPIKQGCHSLVNATNLKHYQDPSFGEFVPRFGNFRSVLGKVWGIEVFRDFFGKLNFVG